MTVEVYGTDEFTEWFEGLSVMQKKAVAHHIDMLEMAGLTLGYPQSSALHQSHYPLRELRPKVAGHALRIIYAFDPRRDAVVLIGGDKTGQKRFYEMIIPKAEAIWRQYLAEHDAGLHDEEDRS